jgi:hypothetical protein
MSENNMYFGGWTKRYIYSKVTINMKNYYLNIQQTFKKKKETSPDYRIIINNDTENQFGAWIKEKDGKKWIYGKITLGNTEYHINIFTNEGRKDNQPNYNLMLNEV